MAELPRLTDAHKNLLSLILSMLLGLSSNFVAGFFFDKKFEAALAAFTVSIVLVLIVHFIMPFIRTYESEDLRDLRKMARRPADRAAEDADAVSARVRKELESSSRSECESWLNLRGPT
jgi:undecaprenyl pyrophosphate phosphatase UppP